MSKPKVQGRTPMTAIQGDSSDKNEPDIHLNNPDIFFDRELSWIDFNRRVLEEANDPENPLLERLKFLSITETNLDEFYMVRVAGLRNLVKEGNDERSLNGDSASEILSDLSDKVRVFVREEYETFSKTLEELKTAGIHLILNPEELTINEIKQIQNYYKEDVSPILTPLAIDTAHPFPHILNKSLNLAMVLSTEDEKTGGKKDLFAVVQVPSVLPRFLQLKGKGEERRFFPLEEIIKLHVDDLFYGMTVKEIYPFRIIRDADISIDEEKSVKDLLITMKDELRNRIWGDAVRMDIHQGTSPFIKNTLRELLELQDHEVFDVASILNINDAMFFYGLDHTSKLKYPFFQQKVSLKFDTPEKIFEAIKKKDRLLHHPYQSFSAIEDLLRISSEDPKVLGIKMTLYRTSGDSPIIQYLGEAAENGKQVTVLVELKARFDEERNIKWAQKLEARGVHVVYGLVGLKIHCKMLLIVRKEDDHMVRYVHLGTGNYNSTTSKYYTDLSFFTVNKQITEDVATIFNTITSYAKMPTLNFLSASPHNLKSTFITMIDQERENALAGKPARIIFKMNSLVDPHIILSLYKASQAGVKVDLIIRGICCLKPGLKGISENITVLSIVGRFLEHTRIYYFHSNGSESIFLASADCMPRNFERRIEVLFPIVESKNKDRIKKILDVQLQDNVKARFLRPDGHYTKRILENGEKPVDSQIERMTFAE
ncbi:MULTISPECIES: polyphosphate kinase 1 [Leptospira]|uniref:Polyphosphate kinase n=5 Tax=Leptospira borgpetersenii TaxID=174 RepID=M3H192_LEPBO|nr:MULTISPECIES: polyphosphate kinase 1 [Leptospira]EMG00859.1 polyphosphate kinase 1 [Leptospira borgpetersenii str. 200701203]ALO26547.1 polyphosphate kinase 1 [Leptospira borgpetersenii serovar Ballum]ANH01146.2 Polyphosphate kinase [Leptospira borgpetersenii str. 4E]AXX16709.1 polyphosphate kinase 1 [Leptospira borgpetersenii serovar Ceylonica]EKP15562.1 polyphosphate kinase 1 [Leptospira borgpetersenii str. 200801926]